VPRPAASAPEPKWWIKIQGNPATFILTIQEYADAGFLREGDHVVVEYLSDANPGRATPGQRIKVERLTCETLDGSYGLHC